MTAKDLNAIEQWQMDGAQHLLTEYPLNQRSVVFDIGGFKGQWTFDLLKKGAGVCETCGSKQDPHVYIFEPIAAFHAANVIRFDEYPKVKCFNFGLANDDKSVELIVDEAASGQFGPAEWRQLGVKPKQSVTMKDITTFVYQNNLTDIALMSINIEGGEYELLDRMIRSGVAGNTEYIQVQFHDFVPDALALRKQMQEGLLQTHDMQWGYPFVWESWKCR